MRIHKELRNIINDQGTDVRDRGFIVLTISAFFVAAIALVGDIIYGSDIVEIITLAAFLVIIPSITLWGIRKNSIPMMTKVLAVLLIFVAIPVAFFFGGGAEGTAIPWLIFVYLYIGLLLSGRFRIVLCIVHSLMLAGLFTYGYFYPITQNPFSRSIRYIDIALSVIEVGGICFVMTWFQNLMFERENEMAREETKKVEELNRSQNRFFSSMSHEIRTPINSVLGLNEIILRQPDASEEILKDAANIRGAGRMLLALINDILDFSKIEAGKMDIVPTNYSIASTISEIVSMILQRAEDKGIEFNVELDPSIPSELYGDEVRIKQILINLLNNAIKYTREGSVTLHVEKETVDEGNVILIFTVTDTGLGIKQDVIPVLFDAFQRVDEDKNVGIEGTGLGLSIVKQLVELMGGTITVDSVYTQGSTFTVALKQKVTRADAVGSIDIKEYDNQSPNGEYKPDFTAEDARILIVDDNEMNLMVESKLLDGTLVEIDTASGGEEALSKTLSERYDLILMDHLMPGMDGIETLSHIRNQQGGLNNHVPVIALTANAGSEMRELYLSSGFEDYLVKPVTGRALAAMLVTHLPSSKVSLNEDISSGQVRLNTASGYSRKLPVAVTCALTCDIPNSILERYRIDTVCYTIFSKTGKYYDGIEATSDELIRYMENGETFGAAPPTVDEYRDFFGNVLKRAHNVLYIAAASGLSPEYERACEAAKSYGNVTVIDSQNSSAAVGMLALVAQQMALGGSSFEKIVAEVESAKEKVYACFLADSIYYANRNRVLDTIIVNFMKMMDIHLFINYRSPIFRVERMLRGDFDTYAIKFMDTMLDKAGKESIDLIVVVYTELDRYQKNMIRDYLVSKHVIFFRSSAVMPVYMGIGTFGMMCFKKGRYSDDLLRMLTSTAPAEEYEDIPEEPVSEEPDVSEDPSVKIIQQNISIDSIPGVDYQEGIRNSGNEDTYKALIEVFKNSIIPSHDELCGYFDSEDWSNYTVKVHALKSSSRLIGALSLSDEAKDLEMAGKSSDIEFIRENHSKLMEHLLSFEPLIGAVFEEPKDTALSQEPLLQNNEISDDEGSGSGADLEKKFETALIQSTFEVLAEAAKAQDADVISAMFDEVIDYPISMEDAEKLEKLQMLFENGDYEKMSSVIDG